MHRAATTGLTIAILSAAVSVSAQEGPTTYERQRTDAVLERENLVELTAEEAEGRPIEFIRIVRDDVFVEEDGGLFGWLTWANIFHGMTREHVISREVLLEEGEPFESDRADETRRNLLDLAIFSYARVLPVRSEGDGVGVLVYARELWSLRTETNFQITGATIDNLQLQLTERNVLGLAKRGTVRFVLVPDTFRIGQTYVDPRLASWPIRLGEAIDFIFNRDSGELEGFFGTLSVRSPFYDLDQRWGFAVEGTVLTQVERQIRGGQVLGYDVPETPDIEALPREWREREYEASAFLLHRLGEDIKQTFGVGFAYEENNVELLDVADRTEEQAAAFRRDILPQERRDLGPVLSYNLFLPTFAKFENLAAYGVTESIRTGPSASVDIGFPIGALGSSTDSITLLGEVGYVLAVDDFLLEGSLLAAARLEDGDWVNKRLEAQVRGATPMVGLARLVWRLRWEGRQDDTNRTLVTLGGDNGLRGFVSQAFFERGGNLFNANFEIRTLPIEVWSVHLGLALFYDMGTVYDSTDNFVMNHAVGIGIRAMFPQFNRLPFRFDLGVPTSEPGVVPSLGANQAVPLTAFEDALAL